MKMSSAIRVALLALIAFAGAAVSSACRADEGFVSLVIYKAGWVIGGSGGGGTLTFHGRSYPLSAGGLDYGLVFGGSKTVLRGASATSTGLPTSPASMARRAQASPSATAPARSC
jgi:hypothetical protein